MNPTALSHSTRVRGLKCYTAADTAVLAEVALYTSAWIEMLILIMIPLNLLVALYTSAWIEIFNTMSPLCISR